MVYFDNTHFLAYLSIPFFQVILKEIKKDVECHLYKNLVTSMVQISDLHARV